jgi:hypothetical protein
MDSARFGRVLGIGTRLAAKTVASAVDAAMAPNPSATATAWAKAGEGTRDSRAAGTAVGTKLVEKAVQSTAQVVQTGQGLKRGGKQFGDAAWRPFVRLSGVLWLEFTGVFFGLFAVSAGVGAWKLRAGLQGGTSHTQFLIAAAVAVVFGYFCVSSFVRAARRERKR